MKVRYTPPSTKIIDSQQFVERKMNFAGGHQSFEQSFSASGREQYEQTRKLTSRARSWQKKSISGKWTVTARSFRIF
jgi:hypothetical protein